MKKLLAVLLTALLAICCAGFAVTAFAADEGSASAGSSYGLYTKNTLNISNWWYEGNKITPDQFDTPAEQPTATGGGYVIPEEYTYFVFDIDVPDSIPLIVDIKTAGNWLEFKFIPDAMYYMRADGLSTFTEAKINENGEIVLSNFKGTIAVPFTSYETKTAEGYTIYSAGIYHIVFHNTLGVDEENDGYWNSKVSNVLLADADYLFTAPAADPQSMVLYSGSLNVTNNWWEGNKITPAEFDTPAEGTWRIPSDYTYFVFDITVDSNIEMAFRLFYQKWASYKPIENATYYTKTADTSYTEKQFVLAENGSDVVIAMDAQTCTVAVPFASLSCEETSESVYNMNLDQFDFLNVSGSAVVSNIMLANDDYLFQVEEGQVSFILLNQSIALAEPVDDGVFVSADGSDVNMGSYWVTQTVMDSFTDALDAAKAITGSEDTTQDAVDAAKNALDAAVVAFKAAMKEGTQVPANYGLLAEEYSIAVQGQLITSFEGGAITDLSPMFDKFKFTLDASAQTVDVYLSVYAKVNIGYEQGYNLGFSAATEIAGEDGGGSGIGYTRADRYYLLLEEGETLASRFSFDEDAAENIGTQTEVAYIRIPAGFKGTVWVPFTAFIPQYTAYMMAIDGLLEEFSIKARDEVGSIAATDVRATAETVEEGLNTNYLSEAIADATALTQAIRVDTDGSTTSVTAQWVPQSAMDALNAAIDTAQGVLDTAEGVEAQDTVDAATAALNAAIETFEAAAAAGTKDYYADLTALTEEAEALLNGTVIATSAAEVEPDEYWVTLEVATSLNAAIETAKGLTKDSLQADLENAIADLNEAMDLFESERAAGTKGTAPGGDEEPGDDTGNEPGGDKGGCGSSVLGISLAGAVTMLACGAVAIRRKKTNQ